MSERAVMAVDQSRMKWLMSSFPTGVTVVTTLDEHGTPKGLTNQAFMSLSIDPPLIVISVARTSRTLQPLRRHGAFVVNFLGAGAERLSTHFASKADDKFSLVSWEPSEATGGCPILSSGALGYVECSTVNEIPVGDHVLFVGQVLSGESTPGDPLLYFRREYGCWSAARSTGSES